VARLKGSIRSFPEWGWFPVSTVVIREAA